MNFHYTQINDPVHGSIHLSELECEIISTDVFQRLHNIKQLGLGVSVYPGANYSRFSHSLGACHIAGRIVDAITRNTQEIIKPEEKQLYRLGGLLHDIGHYPFSHSFEHAAKKHYAPAKKLLADGEDRGDFKDHEKMGGVIIEKSKEIQSILKKHGISTEKVTNVFLRRDPGTLTAILSSDLDCDRLDYLMRTAHHAGLPYGNIDLDYLVNNITLDNEKNVCLNKRALRAADHLLLSRYYDYAQLPFHKTVAALELSFEAIITEFLKNGRLDFSAEAMIKCVEEDEWRDKDDQYIITQMRNALSKEAKEGTPLRMHILAVLERRPPKLVFSTESIIDEGALDAEKMKINLLQSEITKWSEKFNIPKHSWHIWSPQPLSLTKFGHQVPITETNGFDVTEKSQLVLIKGNDKKNPESSTPLVSCKNTLVNQLSDKKYFGIRLYVNIPNDNKELRKKIENHILEHSALSQN